MVTPFSNQLSPSEILAFPRAANSRPENGLGGLWAKHAPDESEASLWVIPFSPPFSKRSCLMTLYHHSLPIPR